VVGRITSESPTEASAPTELIQSEASPTAAPTPLHSTQCAQLALYAPQFEGDEVSWLIDNATAQTLTLQDLAILAWPAANGRIMQIRLGEAVLQEGPILPGDELEISEGAGFTIAPNEFSFLTIVSFFEPGRTGYALSMRFTEGCDLAGEW
jgi:hypothetical protein